MSRPYIAILALDLGTSTSPAKCVIVEEKEKDNQIVRNKVLLSPHTEEISDWPCSSPVPLSFRARLPTYLIYSLDDGRLVYWGFEAKDIIEQCPERIARDNLFAVEAPKTLLMDTRSSPTTPVEKRRHDRRIELSEKIGRQPHEIYEHFLDKLFGHVLSSNLGDTERDLFQWLSHCNAIELVLAFPSGWPPSIHAQLSQSAARAMQKAISSNHLTHLSFRIADIFTTSETICGVKEWLQDPTEGVKMSSDFRAEAKSNFDWINVRHPSYTC